MAKRLGLYALIVFAVYYAVQGGEFTTLHLIRQKSRERMLTESIDSLQHVVDSLKQYKGRLKTDLALQERIARETYGMVKSDKELLYRFVDPDSVSRSRPK